MSSAPPRGGRASPPAAPGNEGNLIDLVGKLTRQGAHLAQEQVALMQAETREAVGDIKAAVAAYAGAAVVGLAGLGVTVMGLGYLLGDAIENTPLGILLAGLITLGIALILYLTAKSKTAAANLKPERTIRTLEDTPAIVTGASSTGGNHDSI